MGVPALFRWLSKKYPKIIYPVVEEEEVKVSDDEGNDIAVPLDITHPNPNGMEFDNLYLDMNGIVHPCTHPEGKPAPETEEDMMMEVFKYTERIVNMIRPRKLLFMAIDGVAPRAKMNQQRSRRFRSAQEAKDRKEARKESIAMWEAMGKTLSEEEKNKESWDSNAITPGTPFMDLLATSLRYWVVQKINTSPGWKQMQVIISDASVPGEGEHKIMDFIRRQRTNPGHDPNTKHVIYGLDADLIMLSLATHEPHFKVLREDVFFQDGTATSCRICGQEGHFAAECKGVKAELTKKTPPEKKPFIFLDVAILREYLEVELNVPQVPFPFILEQAIDDWVLLIFFVGNDFLPHLPSLEIREGAIDTLLKIWKQELPRMGGYLTNHGNIELPRAQIILDGLAKREDEIFRRRREAEERQDQNAKRRKIEVSLSSGSQGPSTTLHLTAPPAAPPVHPSLPPKPVYDFAATADSIGFGAPPTAQSVKNVPIATQALAGSNRDVVANRRAIRMANMSAAEMLKAELGEELHPLPPAKPDLSLPPKPTSIAPVPSASIEAVQMNADTGIDDNDDVPGLGNRLSTSPSLETPDSMNFDGPIDNGGAKVASDTDRHIATNGLDAKARTGVKRRRDDDLNEDTLGSDDDETSPEARTQSIKVNNDGTVEQQDTVKLWEPGYKERYYRQKFSVEPSDQEFKKQLTKSYVEGLCWVLRYYYQGTPSWQWYYPYHFAPFAADFDEISQMDIKFEIGQPFKPFEQLMGVFPAASRKHIPAAFQWLMIDEQSPIIDFYPLTFQIDMNGKRMAWQGVALLPFIDERRLLDAMSNEYPKLNEEEVRRNRWGNNVLFTSDEHPLYHTFEMLYGKKKQQEPIPMDMKVSGGISGSVLRNPDCLPGSTYESPFPTLLPDIKNDRSLSVLYFFPKQLFPHRSQILPGVRSPPRVLTPEDLELSRSGGRGRGRYERGRGNGSSYRGFQSSSRPYNEPNSYNARGDYGGNLSPPYSSSSRYHSPQGYGVYAGGNRGPSNYAGHHQYPPPRGGAPGRTNLPPSGTPYLYSSRAPYNPGGYGFGSTDVGGGGVTGGYGGYGGYGHAGHSNTAPGWSSNSNIQPRGRGRGRGW